MQTSEISERFKMANVNVNRKVTDQFYRYKMPKLIAKVRCTVLSDGTDNSLYWHSSSYFCFCFLFNTWSLDHAFRSFHLLVLSLRWPEKGILFFILHSSFYSTDVISWGFFTPISNQMKTRTCFDFFSLWKLVPWIPNDKWY